MGIKLVTFAAQTVTPQDDALIYETALQESGMIYGGSVSIKNANVLHVEAGHGALCGRKFTIEATDVPVPLTPSGSLQGRIYIHMDLSDTGEPISFQIETASTLTPVVQQSDVNINSGIYEINLATFIVNTSTISDLVNVAPFIDVTPDSEFKSQSSNSVQNKVITKAVGDPETIGGRASKPYSIGELILASDGQLYKATSNIAQNATIVSGGNADPTGNIVSQISNFAKYSTSETDTGQKWIDGKTIYRKVIDFGALPNSTIKSVNHNISGLSFVTLLSAIVYQSSGTQSWQMLNFASSVGVEQTIRIFCNTTQVTIGTGTDRTSFKAYVIMEYTK